ncbi:MAG TPA: hypothetical protein VK886_03695 [Vicinamibacterales bacterium]|nr:hypothetical protein [Vicinamibacterales bacterium]
MALSREALRRLAVHGARTRLQELDAERRTLLREFPELGSGRGGGRRGSRAPAARTTRRRFSAAQRRAISKRMKALWAERRKGKGKAA